MPASLVAFYNRIVNSLSFSTDFYKLRRTLNYRIDSPESIEEFPESHPQGFIKEFKRRRISIVESYLAILHFLESDRYPERIRALRLLEEQTLHSKNLAMPLNTARVQLALMKEAVKNRENRRRQLELLQDFSISSYGQPSVIRRYLDELNIIELPENGKRLSEMDMGWDNHVHDNSSYGRKTPSQLVIDAFIKGISRITVAFNLLGGPENFEELLEAGQILGVTVRFGVEFSAREGDRRFHYMFLLPPMDDIEKLSAFFRTNAPLLRNFSEGLRKNQENRIGSIRRMIASFNETYLPILNEGYAESSVYYLHPLNLEDTDEIVPIENANRMHLGELLHQKYKPVLFRRVLLAKSRMKNASAQHERGEISEWDLRNISSRYELLRASYVELNPEALRETYFSNPQLQEYDTVFDDLASLSETLRASGGKIKVIHPLEYGLDPAYEIILRNCRFIDFVEVYNMYDSIDRPVDDILRFSAFINILNSGDPDAVKPFLIGHAISITDEKLQETVESVSRKCLVPLCGSDATGRSSSIPGMGFIHESALIGKHRKHYLEKHFSLPEFVSRIITAKGNYVDEQADGEVDRVISMGKSSRFIPNKIGDEYEAAPIPLRRAVRYLNPKLKNLVVVAIGFVAAYLTIGLGYALVWFAITSTRHVITDVISRRGPKIREWTWKAINFRNISYSLFWTGFSVPILSLVKNQFDLLWPFAAAGIAYNLAKFFAISFANGLYLVMHNRLRGFDRSVMSANFFRSILSWPFASLFAPLGYLAMIPTIVQSKFWSDVVAGIIEGSGKFTRAVKLTRRDLSEVVDSFCNGSGASRYTAALDLLHIFDREPRGRNSLREIFFGRRNLYERGGDLLRGRKHSAPAAGSPQFENLLAWFEHQSNYQKLSDFAISNYASEYALILTDLIARQYHRFSGWLAAGKKHMAPAKRETTVREQDEKPPSEERPGRAAHRAHTAEPHTVERGSKR